MATWDTFSDNAQDLLFSWAKSRISTEARPPAPAPAPAPVYPPVSTVVPAPAQAAHGGDVQQQIGEILASPRTWLAVSVVALVVVLVKLRG